MIREFYYWMYKGLQKIRKDEDPSFDAFIGMAFFQNLHIIVIGRTIYNMTHFKVSRDTVLPYGIALGLLLLAINYFGLYKKRKQIFTYMNTLSVERYQTGKKLFIGYVILSFLSFFALGFFE